MKNQKATKRQREIWDSMKADLDTPISRTRISFGDWYNSMKGLGLNNQAITAQMKREIKGI